MIQNLFSRISGHYDLMNDVMSLGIHRLWKKEFVTHVPLKAEIIVDVAGGTGDIACLLIKRGCKVHTCDLTQDMMTKGRAKLINAGFTRNHTWTVGEAEHLPYEDFFADAVTMVFGLRNVVDRGQSLSEAYRILKPGGTFVCMEFSPPSHVQDISGIYQAYLNYIIPFMGKWIARDVPAYRYLAESIQSFWVPEEVLGHMAYFEQTMYLPLCKGILGIYKGIKSLA